MQGDRHSDVVSSSSVSSLKQIQHFLGSSSSSCVVLACDVVAFESSLAGLADSNGEELSKTVCESTDCAEKLLVRTACACCEDDSAGGEGLRCEADLCGGNDAMWA